MANKDYTYAQVLAGTGYYQVETTPQYSVGVLTMQSRLQYCGYAITVDGLFGGGTKSIVESFQTECNLLVDGQAGKNTLTQLDKVYNSNYFKTYGKLITSSSWGRTYILQGNCNDIDMLARCIWVEERGIKDAQSAVAQVIKNRSGSTDSSYIASAVSYPNASKWARVIGCSGQYDSAASSQAYAPKRGDPNKADGIDDYWKNAVDLAAKMRNGTAFTVPNGYSVNSAGTVSTTKNGVVSAQMNQVGKSTYQANKSKCSSVVIYATSFSPTLLNVFCNISW